jgi:hypothetical protein
VPKVDLPFEVVEIRGERITPSQLVWRRYRRPAPGILGKLLALNPHVAVACSDQPYIPVGYSVAIPIDTTILAGKLQQMATIKLYGPT